MENTQISLMIGATIIVQGKEVIILDKVNGYEDRFEDGKNIIYFTKYVCVRQSGACVLISPAEIEKVVKVKNCILTFTS